MSGVFRAYDIRGKYPEELNEEISQRIGMAYVRLLKPARIVIGHDMRFSSPALSQAFVRGVMTSAAVDITDIGLTTSPALYNAIAEGDFDGGVMVTASHLPAEMNGFKLCREKAIPLSGDQGLPALENMVRTMIRPPPKEGDYQARYHKLDYLASYIEKISGFVHEPRAVTMVIDAGNGSVGPELKQLLPKFSVWKTFPMYMEPDGSFPHHVANPLIRSTLADLKKRVIQEKADLGIAFDGDADRVGFVDEKGEDIPEDLITALIAEFILMKEPHGTILYDLRSSHMVPETIRRFGGTPVRSRVGHAFIKTLMREKGAVFAGELSGHYYYRDMGFTDNALLTMIHVLNSLSLKKEPLSQLITPLQKYCRSGETNFEVKDAHALFHRLELKYADAKKDHLDGLTVEYDDWWFNVRPSNTEAVVRLNLEARDKQLFSEKMDDVKRTISEELHQEKENGGASKKSEPTAAKPGMLFKVRGP